MSVIYNEKNSTITLNTENTSYQMKIGPYGFLLHTYYGPKISGDASVSIVYRDHGFSPNPHDAGRCRDVSADTIPLEYPCEAAGDFRAPALSITADDGTFMADMRYHSHRILQGKYSLEGLPAVYGTDEDAQTLEVTLKDRFSDIFVTLQYGVFPELDVITRAARIENRTAQKIIVKNAASASLDILSGEWDLIHFSGRHAGERTFERVSLSQREELVGTRRGVSSHHQNSFVIIAERNADERYGQCYGMNLLYSGSFSCNAGADAFGSVRAVMGIQPEHFDYPLEPEEIFQAPEIALAYSENGLGSLSRIYHRLIADHVCRGPWKNRPRPVLINNWEATGPYFDGEMIISIAKKAAELGVDMMVLDDGWFGKRDDDYSGLGDWYVNTKKLGCTMGELADQIRSLGMKFGIWIEPEMVNEDSDLYREHPDWALQIPGRDPVLGRSQLVLDFSREEVVDRILDDICKVLDECKADYVKMDMNRPLVDVYSHGSSTQSRGKLQYKYVLGVYRFMEKLLERYPDLLLEGCSSGGGRFDAGMMYYTPQIWCSDNTDAIDRIRIQYGTSFGYPIRTMGAHVSACPNYDTWRSTPINTRAVVAMEGTFGYELDLNHLSDEEKEEVRQQIITFRKYSSLLHNGLYYRLTDVMKNTKEAAWMMVSEDQSEALLNIVVLDVTGNRPERYIRLDGLDRNASYRDSETGIIYPANVLMTTGITIPRVKIPGHDWVRGASLHEAFQIHLEKVDQK